ncbi:MAG: hypothetical protein Q8P86_01455 [bacterium]|nr:hypothetical protein [bacterium]
MEKHNNFEAVAIEADMENNEKEGWLAHRVSTLRSFVLADVVKVIQKKMADDLRLKKASDRRGGSTALSLNFSDMAGVRTDLRPASRDRIDWLLVDNDGYGKDIPLSAVLEVVKKELMIRYEEKLELLGSDSSEEDLSQVAFEPIPGRENV